MGGHIDLDYEIMPTHILQELRMHWADVRFWQIWHDITDIHFDTGLPAEMQKDVEFVDKKLADITKVLDSRKANTFT